MSEAERLALIKFHASEIQRLIEEAPKKKKIVINEDGLRIRAERLKHFTQKK